MLKNLIVLISLSLVPICVLADPPGAPSYNPAPVTAPAPAPAPVAPQPKPQAHGYDDAPMTAPPKGNFKVCQDKKGRWRSGPPAQPPERRGYEKCVAFKKCQAANQRCRRNYKLSQGCSSGILDWQKDCGKGSVGQKCTSSCSGAENRCSKYKEQRFTKLLQAAKMRKPNCATPGRSSDMLDAQQKNPGGIDESLEDNKKAEVQPRNAMEAQEYAQNNGLSNQKFNTDGTILNIVILFSLIQLTVF